VTQICIQNAPKLLDVPDPQSASEEKGEVEEGTEVKEGTSLLYLFLEWTSLHGCSQTKLHRGRLKHATFSIDYVCCDVVTVVQLETEIWQYGKHISGELLYLIPPSTAVRC